MVSSMEFTYALPVFELRGEFEGTEETPASWVQCAKQGVFFSPKYKKFEITDQTYSELTQNFDEEVNVDYDHFSTVPLEKRPTPDAGKAAGWVKKLQVRGKELWAFVEWTKQAAQQIKNKEWKYISPTFQPNAMATEGESPKAIGAKLFALGLTNQPFLKGMAAVELSRLGLIALAELALEDKQSRIASAFYVKFGQDFETPFIDKFYEDHVICRKSGKIWKIPFETDENFTEFTWGEAVEVVYQPVELTGDHMAGEQNTNNEQQAPKPGETTPKPGETAAQTPPVTPPAPGTDPIMLSRIQNLENENASLRKRLDSADATVKVDKLIREGKITKAQKEWAVNYALSDSQGFETFAGLLKPVVALNIEHGSGESDVNAGEEADSSTHESTVKKFEKKVDELIAANPNMSMREALKHVQENEPQLALSYQEAMQELSSLSD